MMKRNKPIAGQSEFQPLIDRLHDTLESIQGLAQGQADAVVDPATHSAFLLAEAQESFVSRQNRFRSLYEVMASGVLVCTRSGLVEYANNAFCKSLGATFAELSGKRWSDFAFRVLSDDGKPCAPEALPDQTVLGAHVAVRNAMLRVELSSSEEPLWFLAHANRLVHPLSGEITGSLMSWVDVTAMRKAELERVRTAVLEERQRVSRDLHDSLSNRLAAMIWQIEALKTRPEPLSAEEINPVLERLKLQAEEALQDARRSILTLSMPSPDEQSLTKALQELVESMAPGPGVGLRFEVLGIARPLGQQIANTCLRIVQEAAGNAVKHANASDIIVTAEFLDSSLIVRVEDNGNGFDVDCEREPVGGSGFGLRNMRKRAEEIDAELTLESGPSGTTVTLKVSA